MDIIRVENLKLHYSLEAGIKKAIDDITLEIKKGFTVITGPSGSGKSSFIQMIGGLKKPTGGSINVNGTDLSIFNEEDLATFRRRYIGFILNRRKGIIKLLYSIKGGNYYGNFEKIFN